LRSRYPDLKVPVDEVIKKEMEELIVKSHFNLSEFNSQIIVREGKKTDEILKLGKQKNINLAIVGRKNKLRGTGHAARQLTLKSQFSVLFVPEDCRLSISKIQVAVDFSKHSEMAVKEAIYLADKANAEVFCQNVFVVPKGFYKTGKSYEEFSEILRGHAEKDMEKMLKPYRDSDVKVHKVFTLDDDKRPSDKITALANEENIDLIILGSKGRSGAASVLLGSVAERLLTFQPNSAIMILKDEGENMSLLEAFLRYYLVISENFESTVYQTLSCAIIFWPIAI
jgi:nucleotide-binding universal stress UspA family protein